MTTNEGSRPSGDSQQEQQLLPTIEAFMALDAAALKHGIEFAELVTLAHTIYSPTTDGTDNWQLFLNTGVGAVARIATEGPGVVTQALTDFLEQHPVLP